MTPTQEYVVPRSYLSLISYQFHRGFLLGAWDAYNTDHRAEVDSILRCIDRLDKGGREKKGEEAQKTNGQGPGGPGLRHLGAEGKPPLVNRRGIKCEKEKKKVEVVLSF